MIDGFSRSGWAVASTQCIAELLKVAGDGRPAEAWTQPGVARRRMAELTKVGE
jgi:hypothetical protein